MSDPRFPLGTFRYEEAIEPGRRHASIDRVAAVPARLRSAIAGLDEAALAWRYRTGGWTIRQLVHHLADSHMNAFIRLRLALTEDRPTIAPYDESAWGELLDSRTAPVEGSLRLLEALHERWGMVMRAMTDADFARTFVHPAHATPRTLDWLLALYAWHGDHHVAQVEQARQARILG